MHYFVSDGQLPCKFCPIGHSILSSRVTPQHVHQFLFGARRRIWALCAFLLVAFTIFTHWAWFWSSSYAGLARIWLSCLVDVILLYSHAYTSNTHATCCVVCWWHPAHFTPTILIVLSIAFALLGACMHTDTVYSVTLCICICI